MISEEETVPWTMPPSEGRKKLGSESCQSAFLSSMKTHVYSQNPLYRAGYGGNHLEPITVDPWPSNLFRSANKVDGMALDNGL